MANRFSRDRPIDRETRPRGDADRDAARAQRADQIRSTDRSTLLLRCTTIAASIVAAVWLYGQAIQL